MEYELIKLLIAVVIVLAFSLGALSTQVTEQHPPKRRKAASASTTFVRTILAVLGIIAK